MAKKLKKMVCPECASKRHTTVQGNYVECSNCNIKYTVKGDKAYLVMKDGILQEFTPSQSALNYIPSSKKNQAPLNQRIKNTYLYYKSFFSGFTLVNLTKPNFGLPRLQLPSLVYDAKLRLYIVVLLLSIAFGVYPLIKLIDSMVEVNDKIVSACSYPLKAQDGELYILSMYDKLDDDNLYYSFTDLKGIEKSGGKLKLQESDYYRRNKAFQISKRYNDKHYIVARKYNVLEVDDLNLTVKDVSKDIWKAMDLDLDRLTEMGISKNETHIVASAYSKDYYYNLKDKKTFEIKDSYSSMSLPIAVISDTDSDGNYTFIPIGKTGPAYYGSDWSMKYVVKADKAFIQIYSSTPDKKLSSENLLWGAEYSGDFNAGNVQMAVNSKNLFLVNEINPERYILIDTLNNTISKFDNYPKINWNEENASAITKPAIEYRNFDDLIESNDDPQFILQD